MNSQDKDESGKYPWAPDHGLYGLPYKLLRPGEVTQRDLIIAWDLYAPPDQNSKRKITNSVLERERALSVITAACAAFPGFVKIMADTLKVPDALLFAWILLRNRWWKESRFNNTLVSSQNAKGLSQVVPSTLKNLWAKHEKTGRLESPVIWELTLPSVSSACSAGILAFEETLPAVRRHGVPDLVKDITAKLPTPLKTLAAMQYYYHNGTSPIPYWDQPGRTAPQSERDKFRTLLRKETSLVAEAFARSLDEGLPPFVS